MCVWSRRHRYNAFAGTDQSLVHKYLNVRTALQKSGDLARQWRIGGSVAKKCGPHCKRGHYREVGDANKPHWGTPLSALLRASRHEDRQPERRPAPGTRHWRLPKPAGNYIWEFEVET